MIVTILHSQRSTQGDHNLEDTKTFVHRGNTREIVVRHNLDRAALFPTHLAFNLEHKSIGKKIIAMRETLPFYLEWAP